MYKRNSSHGDFFVSYLTKDGRPASSLLNGVQKKRHSTCVSFCACAVASAAYAHAYASLIPPDI